MYALAPGQSTGNYQNVIERATPPFSPLYLLPAPLNMRYASHREVRDLPLNCMHEAIAREVQRDPSIIDQVPTMAWPTAYTEHPLVNEARDKG